MREIKFRAWDKQFGGWCEYVYLDLNGITHWRTESGGYGADTATNIILSQYTGLKDKNGKEIYEGDIYKQPSNNSLVDKIIKDYITGHIEFDNGVYWLKDGKYIFHRIKWTGEVIGNIYENPELLEANK